MKLRIRFLGENTVDTWLSLEKGEVIIGRPGSDLALEDRWCSKKHAMIYRGHDGQLRIADLGSRNGTYLNGASVLSAKLYPGDRVRVGHTEISIIDVRPSASEALACGGGYFIDPPANGSGEGLKLERASVPSPVYR